MTVEQPVKSLTPAQKKELDILERLATVLRDFIMDKEDNNRLIEGEEFTDHQLIMYIMMAVDAFNSLTPISLRVTVLDFPSLNLILEGGAIFAMKSAIFKYIRNAFQYNDAGVQVAVEEKAPEYERTVQRMMQEWTNQAQTIKQNLNLEQCYGGFSSEYLDLFILGKRFTKNI